ncbi:hypothetical protein TNCV_5037801 [Trichonephila clavipes]|nr:hypothetical protein TNCV_5037801 [Trichonephila clavipes]
MSCVTCCAVLLEPQLLDIMIVQFRNEKVSNHGSIPITIDCNVVVFIVFEEGFHQPIKRTKQSVFLDLGPEYSAAQNMPLILNRVMPRIRRNNAYHQVPEFDRDRIPAYREKEIPYRDIFYPSDRNPNATMQTWNQSVPEGHTKRHAGSPLPTLTKDRENRHIGNSALQKSTTSSRTISQETDMFANHIGLTHTE